MTYHYAVMRKGLLLDRTLTRARYIIDRGGVPTVQLISKGEK